LSCLAKISALSFWFRERSHLTLTSFYFLAMMRPFQNGTSARHAESLSI
jgi:hypothetical protein